MELKVPIAIFSELFKKNPKNAVVSKKSVKNWQILYIKLELCDCKERENLIDLKI